MAEERPVYSDRVQRYLTRLYTRPESPMADVAVRQAEARPALRRLLGLERMAESLADHRPTVELGDPESFDGYTRRRCAIETEPDVVIPFWLLEPDGPGPFPLGVFPHGHEQHGLDTYVGLYDSETKRLRIEAEDRDVAVQAVQRGFIAIAPTTRGFEPAAVPDLTNRHDGRHCRSQSIHCLLAGRTAVGERVWDQQRILDWAIAELPVRDDRILMMGNSGGGVVTLYAGAVEERIAVAVPSCSYCTLVGRDGFAHHCDCNVVPGILTWGELYDVAGLIAPRHLLTVNGRTDALFPLREVDRAVAGVRRIYASAGYPERYEHRWGDGGHRFYADLMWPFVEAAFAAP